MIQTVVAVLLSLLVAGCGGTSPLDAGSSADLFQGVDLSKLSPSDQKVMAEAAEDFQAVLSGKKPVHAIFDKDAPLPSDGGTTFYKGNHYRLTVTMTLVSLGGFNGTAFGPRLEFDNTFAPGFNQEISSIRVYSNERLAASLHGL